MRISTATSFYAPVESMRRQQAELERTQREISTGQRLKELAESPAQAAQASDLDRFLSGSERYGANAGLATNRLRMGEVTLTSGLDVLQRVRELAVQGTNDSLDSAARKTIAHEVRDLSDQLLALANRQSESGEYLFAGTRTTSVPFLKTGSASPVSYLGDSREREVSISSSRTIADGFAGDEIFMDVTAGNGAFVTRVNATNLGSGSIDIGAVLNGAVWRGATNQGPFTVSFDESNGSITYSISRADGSIVVPPGTDYQSGKPIAFLGIQVTVQGNPAGGDTFTVVPATGSNATEDVFTTLERLANALDSGSTSAASRAQATSELGSVLQQLDQAIGNLSDTRSSIGSRLRIIDESEAFRQEQEIMVKETLSTLRDVDFAEALAPLNAQMTALQVAQQAYSRISSRTLFDYL